MENFKKIKPEHETSPKEVDDFWKAEFHDQAKQAKADIQDNSDNTSENSKQDVHNKDISELAKEYIDDLKSKSDCPDTIPSDAIDATKLELQPPEKVADKREEFDDNKAKLR